MEVISDEDAEEYIKTNYQRLISETKPNGVYPHDWHRQAQRDADMEEMREIFEEIKKYGDDTILIDYNDKPVIFYSFDEYVLKEMEQKYLGVK